MERTKEQLGSENMVLTKKLDALEEFRLQREQLMAKFDEQETKVEEQKKHYETKIYELEKKHIKEQDRLKRDMMIKLESVAAEFRKAANAQMSATTQRTIRENVSVSAQVCRRIYVLLNYEIFTKSMEKVVIEVSKLSHLKSIFSIYRFINYLKKHLIWLRRIQFYVVKIPIKGEKLVCLKMNSNVL